MARPTSEHGAGARPGRKPRAPGTYALLLEVERAGPLRIGRLGEIDFEAGAHVYVGSAFGPGGLAGRLGHHLAPVTRPHWHVDHLRRGARVVAVWTTTDPRRLECVWARAARALRGAHPVAGFGASDCDCGAHLVALPRFPRPEAFRRHLAGLSPRCATIARWPIRATPTRLPKRPNEAH